MIDRIRDLWRDCERCPLGKLGRTQVVHGIGPAPSKLMLIGEAPGRDEDHTGIPFIGGAGKLLAEVAKQAGVDLGADAYITNLVGCRPPGNRVPLAPELAGCRPRLEAIVAAVKPEVILLLGATAYKSLSGVSSGITQVRGKWFNTVWEWRGIHREIFTLTTFHPAGLLPGQIRDPHDLDLFREDIAAAYHQAYGDVE